MTPLRRDPSLDMLLDLDGEVLVVDPTGEHWVRFRVKRVSPTAGKPHGLDYALTLHGPDGARLVGFDNAHPGSFDDGTRWPPPSVTRSQTPSSHDPAL